MPHLPGAGSPSQGMIGSPLSPLTPYVAMASPSDRCRFAECSPWLAPSAAALPAALLRLASSLAALDSRLCGFSSGLRLRCSFMSSALRLSCDNFSAPAMPSLSTAPMPRMTDAMLADSSSAAPLTTSRRCCSRCPSTVSNRPSSLDTTRRPFRIAASASSPGGCSSGASLSCSASMALMAADRASASRGAPPSSSASGAPPSAPRSTHSCTAANSPSSGRKAL
mmetsp:Transcript_32630/g.83366  ORF Transcript_32630/g.83366 Transcript_32630/m.83366 type:complete len:224 (+) Transcript_32630:144-815(+)